MPGGVSIAYAAIDGIPIGILGDGEWCERELGREGAHVVAPMILEWNGTRRGRKGELQSVGKSWAVLLA